MLNIPWSDAVHLLKSTYIKRQSWAIRIGPTAADSFLKNESKRWNEFFSYDAPLSSESKLNARARRSVKKLSRARLLDAVFKLDFLVHGALYEKYLFYIFDVFLFADSFDYNF